MDKTIFQPNARDRFRLIGLIEGTSFLVLLLIAMPLKYIWNSPLMVKYVGWAHGVLFVMYLFALLYAAIVCRWSFKKVVIAGFAALLPFGPFVLDPKIKNW